VLLGLGATHIELERSQREETHSLHGPQAENDAALFAELQDLLPSHGAIDFIKHHDFGGSFRLDNLDPIRLFGYEWDNAQHEFNDSALEAQRKQLLRAAKYFSEAIAYKTSPRRGMQSVVPEDVSSTGPFPEWIRRDICEIHLAAEALVDEHQKMIRLGRKRLGPRSRRS